MRLLLVCGSRDWPLAVREMVAARGVNVVSSSTLRHARDPGTLARVDAVLLCDVLDGEIDPTTLHDLRLLADALLSHRLTAVLLSTGAVGDLPPDDDAFVQVSPDISADELWGRLATIRQYRPVLRRMEGQVAVMQRLGKKLSQQFTEVDQELRLASRLQRDFLPRSFPEVGDIRFAALYRPATWVSGDVYDIRRLDESRLAFHVADAVGHGVAAGLLTMFIRQAMIGKRVSNDVYDIIPPQEVLAALNAELAQQNLPNCQFVTACYGTIDVSTHEIVFSRGGHPHPLHVTSAGACSEVRAVGGLLGVFLQEEFPSVRIMLEPGEKFIVYSDGLEDAIVSRGEQDRDLVRFTQEFQEVVRLPAEQCLARLAANLDRCEGSLQPLDDQTCIIVERLPA